MQELTHTLKDLQNRLDKANGDCSAAQKQRSSLQVRARNFGAHGQRTLLPPRGHVDDPQRSKWWGPWPCLDLQEALSEQQAHAAALEASYRAAAEALGAAEASRKGIEERLQAVDSELQQVREVPLTSCAWWRQCGHCRGYVSERTSRGS